MTKQSKNKQIKFPIPSENGAGEYSVTSEPLDPL